MFGIYCFPHVIKLKYGVGVGHYELIQEIAREENSAIIFPRGFAKSTWIKIDTLHDIVYEKHDVMLYIGSTLQDAAFHFGAIRAELENNEVLRWLYGDLVPPRGNKNRKWTDKHIETTNEVNLVARGAMKGRGVNIKNNRPSKIVCDDIEDDDMVRSAVQREKLHHWLYHVIFPSLNAEGGFIKMIGTVLALHCEVKLFYQKHGGIYRQAIENGESIWKDMWSIEKLMAKKEEIGSRAFQTEYMNDPIDEENSIIKMEWLNKSYYQSLSETEKRLQRVIMFDPQAGESKTADYYGLSIVSFYPQDIHRYVEQISTGRASQIEQAALVARTWQANKNVQVVGVEKIMTQVAVYQLLLDWKSGKIQLPNVDNNNRNIPIIAVEPKGKDKVARLQVHEPAFERGEIHLHHTMTGFAERLSAFPTLDHDDDIDTVIYALDHSYQKTTFTKPTQIRHNKSISLGNYRKEQF